MKKSPYLLLATLLIFVILYLLLVHKEKRTFSPSRVENFLELDSALVDRIEFGKFESKLIFQKAGGQWTIVEPDSFRADNDQIGRLLSEASHMEVGELISTNPAKQAFFLVDTVAGTRLNFFSGENLLASLVIGKTSSDFLHAYIRKVESDEVYLAKGYFSNLANRKVDQWRERHLLIFDPKQVQEIQLSWAKEKFKLTKEDTSWQISRYPFKESSQADVQSVEEYLEMLSNMKTDQFPAKGEIESFDFSKPQLTIHLTFSDGQKHQLLIGSREGESRYLVKVDQQKNGFVLFEYNFNRLAKRFEDFQLKEKT